MTTPVQFGTPAAGHDCDADASDTNRIRILLVDDDDLFRESLAMNLIDEQFDVTACEDGRASLDLLYENARFDLILLDWRMPGMSGIEVMQEIKTAGIETPVVFLTAFTTERNEATALDCGAVDFLDKSRSASVLARRIRILVNNGRGAAPEPSNWVEILRVGTLDINFRVNRAYWDGRPVPLTTTEFRVVQLLASRAGEDVSYRAIYDVVHGRGFIAGDGSDGYRTNVRSMIKRIRQKFREIDDNFEEIENYPGFGYRWRQAEDATATAAIGRVAAPPPPTVRPHAPSVASRPVDGHGASRVVEAIAQLPFVRSVTSWRRRPIEETVLRARSAMPIEAQFGAVPAPTTAYDFEKMAAVPPHSLGKVREMHVAASHSSITAGEGGDTD